MNSKISIIALIIILTTSLIVDLKLFNSKLDKQDIYYIYLEGKRIAEGENPYSRVLKGDMKKNDKYATYFPGFYYFTAATYKLGFESFDEFITLWRWMVLILHLGIGAFIYWLFYRQELYLLGLLGSVFWLWNRWSLKIVELAHIDFAPILLLLFALYLLKSRTKIAMLFFGLSLGLKHIAIFIGPLFLKNSQVNKMSVLMKIGLIASIPLLLSLPFLIISFEGIFKSLLFSITRNPDFHINVFSIDSYLGWEGFIAKLPMLLLFALIYIAYFKNYIGIYLSSFLILCTFLDFNHVIFMQYFAWATALIPLIILEFVELKQLDK